MVATRRGALGEGKVEQWLGEAGLGSSEALGHLLEHYRAYLWSVAHQQLSPSLQAKLDPSDVVQETFLEAQRDFRLFLGRTESEWRLWLRRILLYNLANAMRRYQATEKRCVQRELSLAAPSLRGLVNALPDRAAPPSSQVLAREQGEALHEALERLPGLQKQVIRWRNYEECSFEEIGRRLDRSAEAARKVWTRAIEQLQQLVQGIGQKGFVQRDEG